LSLAPEVQGAYSQEFLSSHGGLGAIDQPFRRNYFLGKYTQQFNPSNRLDVRYSYEDNGREGDQVGTGFSANATFDNAAPRRTISRASSAASRRSSEPPFNELVVSWSDFENVIQSVTQSDFDPGDAHSPLSQLDGGQNQRSPEDFPDQVDFRDTFSYSLDTHEMKFGGNVARVDPFGAHIPFSSQGTFQYANDGDPENQSIFFSMFDIIPIIDRPNTDVGFFAQDDWRVTDNLTLNLGIRYDVEYGTLSDIEYGTNGRFLTDDPRSPYFGQGTPQDDKDNIAPRLGFAWDVQNDGKICGSGGWAFLRQDRLQREHFHRYRFRGSARSRARRKRLPGNRSFGPDNIPHFDELFAPSVPSTVRADPRPGFEFAVFAVHHRREPPDRSTLASTWTTSTPRAPAGKQSDLNERTCPSTTTRACSSPELARTARCGVDR
jgi:outer membrane receptor protein involved in Fe transport